MSSELNSIQPKDPIKILKRCYTEMIKRVRLSGDKKEFSNLVLWYISVEKINNSEFLKEKAKRLGLSYSEEKFIFQYCRILFRKFLLDLRLSKTLKEEVCSEI